MQEAIHRPLCASCANRDEDWVPRKRTYEKKSICLFTVGNFPNMLRCEKYAPQRADMTIDEAA